MAEITLDTLQDVTPAAPAKTAIKSPNTPTPTPKKKRTRNRGANNVITQRPKGNGKRLVMTEKAMILAEKGNGKSSRQVGREYGVSDNTVTAIWRNPKLNALRPKVEQIKKAMSAKMYLAADMSIEQVADKIQSASARDASIIAGVMIDKARLIEGESTSNQSVHIWMSAINDATISSQNKPVPKS